ncbi:unnamed protein product [Mesocestoides corti]|uniref:SH2 domain-containing protein n=1 Tax=Mesocestoides corti TaxID=53468 RepID=A0A158QS05_MESCO|nr:unnamed protein product [Mesocestoides corti]
MVGTRSFVLQKRPKMGIALSPPPSARWKPAKIRPKNYRTPLNAPEASPQKSAYGVTNYINRQSSVPGRFLTTPYISTPVAPTTSAITTSACQNPPLPANWTVAATSARPLDVPPASAIYNHSAGEIYHREHPSHRSQKYVALHDYTARVEDDLSMLKGQHFYVVDRSQGYWWYAKCATTGKMGYVPFNYLAPVTSLESNEYRKRNFCSVLRFIPFRPPTFGLFGYLTCLWFWILRWHCGNMRRLEAENCLMMSGNVQGSFLIRVSESRAGEYSLSVYLLVLFVLDISIRTCPLPISEFSPILSFAVRDGDVVKHYRIRSRASRSNADVRRYFISRQLPFSSIQQLVEHYMKNQSGLCCQLTTPCIKVRIKDSRTLR